MSQKSFIKEAKTLQSLIHPNIVELYAFDVIENSMYVLEYMNGGSLLHVLREVKESYYDYWNFTMKVRYSISKQVIIIFLMFLLNFQ